MIINDNQMTIFMLCLHSGTDVIVLIVQWKMMSNSN